MKALYVLDIETTGLAGTLEGDKVLEVGVARVDLKKGKVHPELNYIVHQFLTPAEKTCWCFQNTSLTPEDVTNSPHELLSVLFKLYQYARNGVFTSYNRSFDFDLFLNPLGFKPHLAPCIMLECADHYNGGQWLKAQEMYDQLCPDNPAAVPDGKEEHRALSDAVLEGWILLRYLEDNPDAKQRYLKCLRDETCANCACYYRGKCCVQHDIDGHRLSVDPANEGCIGFTDSKSGSITTQWCMHCNKSTQHQYLYTYFDGDNVIQVDKCLVCDNRKHW